MSDDLDPRSVSPDPRAQALIRDGRALFAQGDVERARQCFAAAVAIAPDDAAARAGLDRCRRLLAEGLANAGRSPSMPIDPRSTVEIRGPIDLRPELPLGAALGDDDGPEATVVDPHAQRLIDAELARARGAGGASRAGAPRAAPDADDGDDDSGPDDQTRVEHDPAEQVGHQLDAAPASRTALAGADNPGDPYAGEQAPGLFRGEGTRAAQYVGGQPPRSFGGEGTRADQYVGEQPPRSSDNDGARGAAYGLDTPYGPGGRGPGAPRDERVPRGPGAAHDPGATHDQRAPHGPGAAHDQREPHGPGAAHDQRAPHGPGATHDQRAPDRPGATHDQRAPHGPGALPDPRGSGMPHGQGVHGPLRFDPTARGPGAPQDQGTPYDQARSRPFPAAPAGRFPSPGHAQPDPMGSQGYAAAPDAGYASTRFPAMATAQEGRSRRVWLIAAAVVAAAAGIAIVIGFAASGGDEARSGLAAAGAERVAVDGGAAGGEVTEATARSPGSDAGTGAAAGDPGAAAVPALSPSLAPGAAEVRVGRIEHPVVAVVVASTDGAVERIHVKAGGSVTTGQKLYSLRAGKGVRSSEAIVSSPAAGRIERRAARGDRVAKGDVLAHLVDPEKWLMIADLRSDQITTAWSCTIATSEGRNRAPCRVESVQRLNAEQSRATVTVATTQAAWLQGGEQALLLRLIPPGAPGEPTTPTAHSSAPGGSTGGARAPGSSAKDAASSSTDRRGPDAGP